MNLDRLGSIELDTRGAGLIGLIWESQKAKWKYVCVHFFPLNDIQWGYEKDWYDGPHYSFGIGPLLLLTWSW